MSIKGQGIEITLEKQTAKSDNNKKNTAFDVVVKYNERTYTLTKAYKDFKLLLYQLKKYFPALQELKLPYKRFFSVKSDIEIAKERKEALVMMLSKIIECEKVLENDTFKTFFKLDDIASSAITNSDALNIFSEKEDSTNFDDFQLGCIQNNKAKISDFEILKVIGKGSFGRVYLVKHKSEKKYYAMKVLEKNLIVSRNESRHIMAERAVLMKNVKHPFLVALHYSFQTPEKLYFILDYVNGGELFFHLQNEGTFNEARVRFYAAEIGDALGFLHGINIIYRDLKPENILLSNEGHIVLTDFGLAKEVPDINQTTTTFCGTPEYLAPEIILKVPYDKTVDWWCYGCVLYEMINGLPPFYSRDMAEMYNSIVNNPLVFRIQCSMVTKAFIDALLQKDHTQRLGYGPGDWNDIKEHPFLKRINWDDLYNKRIKPPFNPNVSSELDLKNIDKEFVCEEITESITADKPNPLGDGKGDNPFVGFTYVQNNDFH